MERDIRQAQAHGPLWGADAFCEETGTREARLSQHHFQQQHDIRSTALRGHGEKLAQFVGAMFQCPAFMSTCPEV